MIVFKRKQIVVLSLVIMIVIAGYLQYNYNKSSTVANEEEKGRLGEAVYVGSEDLAIESNNINTNIKVEEIPASKEATDFFVQAKLDREITRSRDTDSLKEMSESLNVSEEIKNEAYEKMMLIVDNTEKEMRLETLINERGFDDAIVLFGDDGSIDIIVKTSSLSSSQVAQITDIVTRQANVEMEKIHIKYMY